jgi:hypothetical protein
VILLIKLKYENVCGLIIEQNKSNAFNFNKRKLQNKKKASWQKGDGNITLLVN